jgi:predicted MFS family arabinose efflux permease
MTSPLETIVVDRETVSTRVIDDYEPVAAARWTAVSTIALGVFSFVTTEFLPVGILPQIALELKVSLATAGLMLTAPGLVAAIFAPATLLLAGSIDRRHLLLGLVGLLFLADVLSGLAPNFPVMLLGRGLLGAGLGGFWTMALATGGRLVPAADHPRALSLILAGITLATILGLPMGSLIGNYLGWRASFLTAALLAAIAGLGQAMALPHLPASGRVTGKDVRFLLSEKSFRAAMLLVLCLFGGNLASYTYLAPFLRARAGFGAGSIPLVLLGFGLISFLANALMPGALAKRPRLTVAMQALLMAVAMLVLALPIGSFPLTIALLFAWAIPFGAVPLCLNHWTQELSGRAPEAGSALYVSTVQVAIALGSAAGAFVVARLGLPANFWLGAALSIAGGILLAWPHRTSKAHRAHPEN